jgi:transposase
MRTRATRGRMAAIEKKTKRYPSDPTDEEWSAVEPLLPHPANRGRKRATDLREVVNAIRYMVRSGCEWRMLPVHFPPWQTVYWWFRRFVRLLLFRTIHDLAAMIDRERTGREASPSAGVIDSQTVKAPMAAKRSSDAVISCRVIATAAPIDAAPLPGTSIFQEPASNQTFTVLGIPHESIFGAVGITVPRLRRAAPIQPWPRERRLPWSPQLCRIPRGRSHPATARG